MGEKPPAEGAGAPTARPERRASASERRSGLERRLGELERAEKARQDFFAALCHELRNPIQGIHANALLIRSRARDVELIRPAEAIDRQLARLSGILDDLMDVVRLAQGEELSRATIPLQQAVTSAIEAARKSMDAHRRELSVQVPEEPLYVHADAARLSQAIANILSNAIKYSPQQGEIVVRAFAEGGQAVLSVRDHGVGIAPEDLPNLFDRFSRLLPTEHIARGLGLGLHIARELVELHEGTIEARSDGPGQGAEFVIRLPLSAKPAASEKPARSQYRDAKPLRILVIDDNRDAADALATLLELNGHTGLVAYDGPTGLEKAEKLRPHVALVDIGMPTMDGYEVAHRIAGADWGRETVLVAVTGWGARSDRARSREAGFAYHLTKPVDYDALEALLSTVARKPRPAPVRR